ncbi:MAG TPA: phosphonate ABC transporter ATP-binding protein [Bacillus bacterium]|nr:phosphonate ABC transporter ATP-binding protein [Bacillus sp. (in: firmicutes)]
MEMVLKVKNLTKIFEDGTKALDGIDLEIRKGEFISVIGSSGAGKSTLFRCLNRLEISTDGTIQFLNEKVEQAGKKELRKIRSKMAMIFQNYKLIDRSTVLENVLHGRLGQMSSLRGVFSHYSEDDKREAIQFLEQVGLHEEIYKRADELSGGQKQRVGVCRALMQHPKLILADEPIASLDPVSAKIVMDSIYNACIEKEVTCLVNLHQIDIVKKYSTRIIAIRAGRIVFDGDASNLTTSFLHKLYEGNEHEML